MRYTGTPHPQAVSTKFGQHKGLPQLTPDQIWIIEHTCCRIARDLSQGHSSTRDLVQAAPTAFAVAYRKPDSFRSSYAAVSAKRYCPSKLLLTLSASMSYHHFQILIHRPWTSRRSQPWTGQGPGFRHARHMCSTSATAISSLIIRYEKDYSLRFMHNYSVNIIFSAALISLFNVIACQARRVTGVMLSEATANLGVFFRGLDDLSQSFDSAKRAREHLATIQRKWYLSGNATGSKRAHLFQHNAAGAKRSRPTESFPAMT